MSLDVYLNTECISETGTGIFVRENGQVKEISRAEWNKKFPNRELVIANAENKQVYWSNITHNLNTMANKAGLYECLWRPNEQGMTHARDLIEPMEKGLALLKNNKGRFEKFNASNGWGTYEQFVPWVEDYLEACKEYPNAKVETSR